MEGTDAALIEQTVSEPQLESRHSHSISPILNARRGRRRRRRKSINVEITKLLLAMRLFLSLIVVTLKQMITTLESIDCGVVFS